MRYGTCLLTKNRIKAFDTKYLWKLLCISYFEHRTNDWVWSKINFLVGLQEPLPTTGERQALAWFGNVMGYNSLLKTILQGTLEGGQCYSWQRKCWMDNVKDWTSLSMPELLTMASHRKDWKRISTDPPCPPHQCNRSRDRTEHLSSGWPFIRSSTLLESSRLKHKFNSRISPLLGSIVLSSSSVDVKSQCFSQVTRPGITNSLLVSKPCTCIHFS